MLAERIETAALQLAGITDDSGISFQFFSELIECDFFKRAYKAIPGEDISFISEDAYFGIETVGWSVQGEDYLLSESLTMQTICVEMDNHFCYSENFSFADLSDDFFSNDYTQAA